MGIVDRMYQLYMQNSFRPGPVGFLINSAYIVRTSIYRAIQRNAKELSGNVLDFGCGSKAYEHLFTVDKYTGIDVEQSGHGHEHELPYDFGRYSAYGLTHLLKKHGFTIIRQEKDSHFMQVVAQLWSLYLYTTLHTRNKYLNIITSIVLVFPSTLIGWILAKNLPRNDSLYFNIVIVTQKAK